LVRPQQKRVVAAAAAVVVAAVAPLRRRVVAAAEVVPLRQQADNAVQLQQTQRLQLRSLPSRHLRLVTRPMPTPALPLLAVVADAAVVVALQQLQAEQPPQPVDVAPQHRLPVQA
jgi:hypothetical protein